MVEKEQTTTEYLEEAYGLHIDSVTDLEELIWDLQSQKDNWED